MTVREITSEDIPIVLEGSKTLENPLYVYFSPSREFLLVSENLKDLLKSPKIEKPLEINEEGISFLLQSGVVPTPHTLYKNLFVLSMGDKLEVATSKDKKLEIRFDHEYYYFHKYRNSKDEGDIPYFLDLLKEAILKRLNPEKEIYLFHSAGKDSNIIALSLAESDLKDKVICLTLKGPPHKDESLLAKELAKKLGLTHVVFHLPDKINDKHIEFLKRYFQKMMLPCADGVALVYPFYAMEFDFRGVNLLDGSGVDVFAGHIPRKVEFHRQLLFSKFHFLRPISDRLPTGNLLQKITLTRPEWVGFNGFTYLWAKKIFPQATPVYPFWRREDKKRKRWDYFDLKGDLWATHLEFGNVMRKVRILAEFSEANLIFPFTDKKVATYLATLPEKLLFDRRTFKNKLFFRKILKEKLNYDVDKFRKYSYPFDAFSFLEKMKFYVEEEIFKCSLWDKRELSKIYFKLNKMINSEKKSLSKLATNLIVRLFLISAWYNNKELIKCKY